MKIPRQHSRSETIEPPKFIQATKIAKRKQIPCIEHLIPVPKADSTIMIEITPNSSDHNINIFLSYESIPTYSLVSVTGITVELPFFIVKLFLLVILYDQRVTIQVA